MRANAITLIDGYTIARMAALYGKASLFSG
jgi:hypothetical protein